jgi:outer membrane immunogenic protein
MSGCAFHVTDFEGYERVCVPAIFISSLEVLLMKRMLIGIAAATSLFGASAFAADLSPRTYTKAPAYVDPGYNWSGFYLGGNVGYGWGRSSNSETLSLNTTAFTNNSRNDVDGVIGGGQIGYNWQVTNWLFGLEADFQGSDQRGTSSSICVGCGNGGDNITATLTQKLNWFGTVRGRVGILATPNVLLYGTGGLAYGEVETGGSLAGPTNLTPLGTFTFPGTSSTRVGWTAGAGVEGRIAGNWTAKLEYLYMDLGTTNAGPIATNIVLLGGRLPGNASYSSHFTDNTLRAGVNYHFNSGPVVAKY